MLRAAGIAILAVSKAEIFLGKRLQCELRKTYPGRNKLAARFSDLEFQPLDGQGVGGRTPSQIDVGSAVHRLVFPAIFKPAAVLRFDLQSAFAVRIKKRN